MRDRGEVYKMSINRNTCSADFIADWNNILPFQAALRTRPPESAVQHSVISVFTLVAIGKRLKWADRDVWAMTLCMIRSHLLACQPTGQRYAHRISTKFISSYRPVVHLLCCIVCYQKGRNQTMTGPMRQCCDNQHCEGVLPIGLIDWLFWWRLARNLYHWCCVGPKMR